MDRILDAVFDLFIWPFITCLSLFKYSIRTYYHETPARLRTIRVFLKTGLGWGAIYVILWDTLFLKRTADESIFTGDPRRIIFDYGFVIVILMITLALPLLFVNWFALDWRHLRNRILKAAIVRDVILIAWSGYLFVTMVMTVLLLFVYGPGAFPSDRLVAFAWLCTMLFGIAAINYRATRVLTIKYARTSPKRYIAISSSVIAAFLSFVFLFGIAMIFPTLQALQSRSL